MATCVLYEISTDCSEGVYGRFCNISCEPGRFGRSCAGLCTPICSLEECDPFYGCKLTTGNLIRQTSSGFKYIFLNDDTKRLYFPYDIVPASVY